MADLSLRPGVKSNFLVRRRVRFAAEPPEGVAERLEGIIGFNRLAGAGRQRVLEYDASAVQIDRLMCALAEAGAELDGGRLQRVRFGWYRYQDANIAANAKDTGSTACSQSPLRFR